MGFCTAPGLRRESEKAQMRVQSAGPDPVVRFSWIQPRPGCSLNQLFDSHSLNSNLVKISQSAGRLRRDQGAERRRRGPPPLSSQHPCPHGVWLPFPAGTEPDHPWKHPQRLCLVSGCQTHFCQEPSSCPPRVPPPGAPRAWVHSGSVMKASSVAAGGAGWVGAWEAFSLRRLWK